MHTPTDFAICTFTLPIITFAVFTMNSVVSWRETSALATFTFPCNNKQMSVSHNCSETTEIRQQTYSIVYLPKTKYNSVLIKVST